MVRIEAHGNDVLLKPLERSHLDIAAKLYNSGSDIRFATGVNGEVSSFALAERLDILEDSKDEFMTGIFAAGANHAFIGSQVLLVGVISGLLNEKTIWIKLTAILPQFRHLGIGSRAVGLLLQHSKACYGTTEAFLSVVERNDQALRFWLGQGFSEAGRFEKVLFNNEQPYKVIIMNKVL